MINLFSGVKCGVCGMAIENANYRKDDHDETESLYWANPKICEYTEVRVDFCGPQCSYEWWSKKIEAREKPAQE